MVRHVPAGGSGPSRGAPDVGTAASTVEAGSPLRRPSGPRPPGRKILQAPAARLPLPGPRRRSSSAAGVDGPPPLLAATLDRAHPPAEKNPANPAIVLRPSRTNRPLVDRLAPIFRPGPGANPVGAGPWRIKPASRIATRGTTPQRAPGRAVPNAHAF